MADRRKTLEALVAKRKAETETANARRNNKQIKPSPSSAIAKNHSSGKSNSSFSGKPSSLSPLLKKSKESPAKKKAAPTKTKKRVDKYDSEDDEDEDRDEDDSGSDDESDSDSDSVKKKNKKKTTMNKSSVKAPPAKGGSSVKSASSVSDMRGKPLDKKTQPLQKAKVKKKHGDSSEESSDEDEGKGGGRKAPKDGASDDNDGDDDDDDDDDEGLDLSNVISDRTRRRAAQPVQYNFPDGSGDDDDSD